MILNVLLKIIISNIFRAWVNDYRTIISYDAPIKELVLVLVRVIVIVIVTVIAIVMAVAVVVVYILISIVIVWTVRPSDRPTP